MVALYMFLTLVLLLAGAWLVHRLPPRAAMVFWLVAPFALLPVWIGNASVHHWSNFLWAKLFSVPLAAAWCAACAAFNISGRAVRLGVGAFLLLNILEAIALDASGGNYVNTLAGIILLGAAQWSRVGSVDRAAGGRVEAELSWTWIAAYTVWDACFLYGNWSSFAFGQHVPVLLAPIVLALRPGSRHWLLWRAETLGLYLMSYATFFGWFRTEFDTHTWNVPAVQTGFGVVSLGITLVAFLQRVQAVRASKTAPVEGSNVAGA